ncbi:MAG: helix-turn-helix domain-containing protein, partial [Pseudonocardiaceae bacterium]
MDAEEARTIGRRVRQIRNARGLTQQVVADRAGISKSYLCRVEKGQRALGQRSRIVALAAALEIAPSELTKLAVPAPANGETDAAIQGVFLALMAASRNRPGGMVLPVTVLRDRVISTIDAHYGCDP